MSGPWEGGGAVGDPAAVVDVSVLGVELVAQAVEQGRGLAVQRVVDQPHQRQLLLGMPAGGGLPEHDAPKAATLHCLSGAVTLVAGERRWELTAGTIVPVPQERHHVEAAADSICLLTVCR